MTAPATTPRNGMELIEAFLPMSPFVGQLQIRTLELEPDHARVLMPWRGELATYGDIVHGGAIAALIDITAMATAWSGAELPEKMRGVTVAMSINYVDAARAEDLVGDGRVVRRGSTLTNCEIDVLGEDGRKVAKGIATYKVG